MDWTGGGLHQSMWRQHMHIVDEHGWMCTHTTDTVWCPCALRIKHSPTAMNAFRRSPDISASMESTMSRLANWEGRGGGEGESTFAQVLQK